MYRTAFRCGWKGPVYQALWSYWNSEFMYEEFILISYNRDLFDSI
jgi:hypothetical protein